MKKDKRDQKKRDTNTQNKTSHKKKNKKDKAKNKHVSSQNKNGKHVAKKHAVCPCCSKHCPLTKPKCSKGKRLAARLDI